MQSVLLTVISFFVLFKRDSKFYLCLKQKIQINTIVIYLDHHVQCWISFSSFNCNRNNQEFPTFPKLLRLIRYPIDAIASDPNKSWADSSLRKRFEANLSDCFWRQYRLQNFWSNYLKLSLLFSHSSKLLSPPTFCSIRLIYSCITDCSFSDEILNRLALYVRNLKLVRLRSLDNAASERFAVKTSTRSAFNKIICKIIRIKSTDRFDKVSNH